MKTLLLISFFLLLFGCSKPKSVLICGDHECINKNEAEQFFEENLSLEVKIIKNKKKKEIDLVQLNLRENDEGKREIILTKKQPNEKIKVLSNEEIKKIKKNIKKKKKKGIDITKKTKSENKNDLKKNKVKKELKINKNNANKSRAETVDICTIIKKCSIDEISKFLLKEGKKKDFPDITIRQ